GEAVTVSGEIVALAATCRATTRDAARHRGARRDAAGRGSREAGAVGAVKKLAGQEGRRCLDKNSPERPRGAGGAEGGGPVGDRVVDAQVAADRADAKVDAPRAALPSLADRHVRLGRCTHCVERAPRNERDAQVVAQATRRAPRPRGG